MRKVIVPLFHCSIAIFLLFHVTLIVFAQEDEEATPSADTLDKINLIKEKVASKVAELDKAIQYAADGTIAEIEEGLFSFSADGEDKTINTDEDTNFLIRNNRLQTNAGEFADLAVNDTVTVVGTEQVGTGIVNAKLVVRSPQIVFFAGKINEVNANNFTFTVKENDEEYTFDYETYTKALSLTTDNAFETAGFSEIKADMHIQILALPQQTSETVFTSLRLLLIP